MRLKALAALRKSVISILFALAVSVVPAIAVADDVILSGDDALKWLRDYDYIDNANVPLGNFNEFRSQVLGGGAGPYGLKAIIAEGWTFRGPMTAIQKPVVIVVPEETVGKKPSPSLVDVPTLGIKVAGGSDVVIRGWCIYISTENGNEISRIAINVDPADLDEFLKANRCGAPDPYRRYVVDIQARRKSDGSAIDNYNVEVSGQ